LNRPPGLPASSSCLDSRLVRAEPRSNGGFYHDGRYATLMDVVTHYDTAMSLALTAEQKNDLVEYLKSL
jgi:hypothetical protein